VAIQYCLNRLAGAANETDAQKLVRELLSVAAGPILSLCGTTLGRRYPRLAKGPFNVQPEDLLGAVAERLIKAMRNVRPAHVGEFFALTMKHIRWELNGLVRQLDAHRYEPLRSDVTARQPEPSDEQFSPLGYRVLEAIQGLEQSDQEIFSLVRLQGMTQRDAAEVLGMNEKTVQRRLTRIMPYLWARLGAIQRPTPVLRKNKPLRVHFNGPDSTAVRQFPRSAV
jgi:RNA polymerase sigma-70 factor (ECF subfamily)